MTIEKTTRPALSAALSFEAKGGATTLSSFVKGLLALPQHLYSELRTVAPTVFKSYDEMTGLTGQRKAQYIASLVDALNKQKTVAEDAYPFTFTASYGRELLGRLVGETTGSNSSAAIFSVRVKQCRLAGEKIATGQGTERWTRQLETTFADVLSGGTVGSSTQTIDLCRLTVKYGDILGLLPAQIEAAQRTIDEAKLASASRQIARLTKGDGVPTPSFVHPTAPAQIAETVG